MSKQQAAQQAAQYMKAQAAIMQRHGEAPKLSGKNYDSALRATTETFRTISAKSK